VVFGAATVLLGGGRMLAPRGPAGVGPEAGELDRAALIISAAGRCTAHLAFTGDKRLHFSENGNAFLMYQIEGRSWVAMGDPVGEPAEFRELLRAFVERADRHGGRPVFYSIHGTLAGLYRECGLTLVKLGEEALVPLDAFSLTGSERAGLRRWRNANQRAGCSVEVVEGADVVALLPELRAVSDAWLEDRRAREKRFSLGAFDDDYVCRFPVAVVRQADRIVAFATLWISGDGREVQVDLMRRVPDGPSNVMNYLFVECMLWAKEAGCSVFNLGMAPLSGLRTDATAPFWDRIGHVLWTHGEQFYNFQGLRHFKERFDPEWQTRYVAAHGGPGLPTAMLNVATLVGGGVRGMLAR
jgi:phosphatidylglycerol lysyltransferase